MSRTRAVPQPDRLPAGKLLAWAGAGISAGANFIILGYFSLYATDTLGLPAAGVGVIVLISSLTNVAGGLIAAWIVDRSPETRWGKARPYEFAVLGTWIATWLLFSTPAAFDQTGRIIWLAVTYISINAVFDALLRANDTLYMARAFANRHVYAKVTTRAGIFTTLGGIVMSITLPVALNAAGKSPELWSITVLCFAVPLALIGMTRFAFVKEEYRSADVHETPVRLRDLTEALRTTPWIWLVAGLMLLAMSINGANMISYYFRYIVGNLALQGAFAAVGILILPVVLIIPRLMRRFAISQILLVGSAIGLVGAGFYAIANGNLLFVLIGGILGGVAMLPISYLGVVMVLDICRYNEWRGKRRMESTMGALTGVAGRIGTGLAGLVVGLVLSASGYDGTQDTQPPQVEVAITALFAGIPALVFGLIFVLMLIYSRFDRKLLPIANTELDARDAEAAGHDADDLPPLVLPGAVPIPGTAAAPPEPHA